MTENLRQAIALALGTKELMAEFNTREKALNGKITLAITASKTKTHTSAAWSEVVEVVAKDDEGNVHTWLNQAFASKASVADTSSDGTASINATTLTFVNGVAKVTLSGTAADWLATETATVTIANLSILGFTVIGGTFVVTIN